MDESIIKMDEKWTSKSQLSFTFYAELPGAIGRYLFAFFLTFFSLLAGKTLNCQLKRKGRTSQTSTGQWYTRTVKAMYTVHIALTSG